MGDLFEYLYLLRLSLVVGFLVLRGVIVYLLTMTFRCAICQWNRSSPLSVVAARCLLFRGYNLPSDITSYDRGATLFLQTPFLQVLFPFSKSCFQVSFPSAFEQGMNQGLQWAYFSRLVRLDKDLVCPLAPFLGSFLLFYRILDLYIDLRIVRRRRYVLEVQFFGEILKAC